MVKVRKLRRGEFLPDPLIDPNFPVLDCDWCFAVTPEHADLPFALFITSYVHGWIFFWRVLSVQPLPQNVVLYWILEALPQILDNARDRGCVGVLTMFMDASPIENKLARIMIKAGGAIAPISGSVGAMPLLKG